MSVVARAKGARASSTGRDACATNFGPPLTTSGPEIDDAYRLDSVGAEFVAGADAGGFALQFGGDAGQAMLPMAAVGIDLSALGFI